MVYPLQSVETHIRDDVTEKNPLEEAMECIEVVAKESLTTNLLNDAQQPLLEEALDLEAGTVVSTKKAKKAKKLEKQEYLLEFELPILGKIKVAPFYSDDDDDDDNAAKRELLGIKENAAFAVGLTVISVLSGYFYKTPFVSSAIAGGAMDISKTWYVYTEKSPRLRNSARMIAAITLIGAIVLQYQAGDKEKLPVFLQILSALPGVYPAMGFLKAEIGNIKPEKLAKKCRLSITKKTAESFFSAILAAAGLSLTFANERNLSAAGGIFFKTNIRNLSDIVSKQLVSLDNPCVKALAGTATAISSVAAYTMALLGSPLGWYSSTFGKLAGTALIVPPSDVASRTVKASIKADLNERKAAKKAGAPLPEDGMIKKGLTSLFHVGLVGTASAATGIMADPTSPDIQNSGVIAALFGDVVSFSKVATKRFDERVVMALSALGFGASALTYGMVESGTWTLPKIIYSSNLVFGALSAAYAIYHLKRLVRPEGLPVTG